MIRGHVPHDMVRTLTSQGVRGTFLFARSNHKALLVLTAPLNCMGILYEALHRTLVIVTKIRANLTCISRGRCGTVVVERR